MCLHVRGSRACLMTRYVDYIIVLHMALNVLIEVFEWRVKVRKYTYFSCFLAKINQNRPYESNTLEVI